MSDATRLDSLAIGEVSGVDHPAHLTEGWMVLKSASGLTDEDWAEVMKEAQALAAASESTSPSEEVAVSDDSTQTDLTEDVIKSLPEPVRKAIETANARAEQAEALAKEALSEVAKSQEEVAKAREAKADAEAVTKARDEFGNIPDLDPEVFGPALRKAAEAAPEAVEVLTKALSAANAALGADSALFKEVGSSVTPGAGSSAYAQIQTLAKSLVAEGKAETVEQGVVKALASNPHLYDDYRNEEA